MLQIANVSDVSTEFVWSFDDDFPCQSQGTMLFVTVKICLSVDTKNKVLHSYSLGKVDGSVLVCTVVVISVDAEIKGHKFVSYHSQEIVYNTD